MFATFFSPKNFLKNKCIRFFPLSAHYRLFEELQVKFSVYVWQSATSIPQTFKTHKVWSAIVMKRGFGFLWNEKHSVTLKGNLFCHCLSWLIEELCWRQPCWKGIYYTVQYFSQQHLFQHVDSVKGKAIIHFCTITPPISDVIELGEEFRALYVFCGGEVAGCTQCRAKDPVEGWLMWTDITSPLLCCLLLMFCNPRGHAF